MPFVLLDGGASGRSCLYREPVEIVETRDPAHIRSCLDRLRRSSLHAAGFLSYEAGYALEPKLTPFAQHAPEDALPLLWFGLFEQCEPIDPEALLPDPAGAWAGAPEPLVGEDDYEIAVARVQRHIVPGRLSQVHLSFSAEAPVAGSPGALYAALRARAEAAWGALLFTGTHWILSRSPEHFFTLGNDRVTVKPMTGTASLATTPEGPGEDPKPPSDDRTIVGRVRDDLLRVAKLGMVTAELREEAGPIDVLEAIFPCGSITGAPKVSAMELIAGIEAGPRGVYTGAIGRVAPDGQAAFNVVTHTLVLRDGGSHARIGLGAEITADSVAADAWRECIAKGAFVKTGRNFDLIETMRFDPSEGIVHLERHLGRMKASAEAFGFTYDRHHTRNELQAATFRLRSAYKLRLRLSASGAIAVEARPLAPVTDEPLAVKLVPLPVEPDDFRLRHKTSDRAFYDDARTASGADEVVFVRSDGLLTEGSFTSLFVEHGGGLVTPPLARGLLPGVLRDVLLASGGALESDVEPADLKGRFFVGNAVRGLIAARLVGDPE